MPEEIQPVKRGPGRPRKVAAPKVEVAVPPDDAWKTSEPIKPLADERIGMTVDDLRWLSISFQDGREYRVEDGVIVERVR